MDDPQAAFDMGLGREFPPSLAHRLEKKRLLWKSLAGMVSLLSEMGLLQGHGRGWDGSGRFAVNPWKKTKTLPGLTAYPKPSKPMADKVSAQSYLEATPMSSTPQTVQEQLPANLAALHQKLKEMAASTKS